MVLANFCATRSSASSQPTALAADLGMKQAPVERQRFAQRRALRTEAPEIGRMVRVAFDAHRAIGPRRRDALRSRRRNRGMSYELGR